MKNREKDYDVIIAGAGMGGMSAASLLAKAGYSVLVLEKSHVPGGCSSSYFRKGYIFESGATTLIGFDENQPLRILEDELNIELPKTPIQPSMTVHLNGKEIIRWENRDKWIEEAVKWFGEASSQKKFWQKSFDIADIVWKVSGKNNFFPPVEGSDYFQLLNNDFRDLRVLPNAFISTKKAAVNAGISNPEFYQFLDEQLMISSQATASETPYLFGAPAITYTNYTNYYVNGGLIEMARSLERVIQSNKGIVKTKEGVRDIRKHHDGYSVLTSKGLRYRAKIVISNIPVWNMPGITSGNIAEYFRMEAKKYNAAWGAFTMGLVTDDVYPDNMSLHHQIHTGDMEKTAGFNSNSVFISLSDRDDSIRSKDGNRVLNVSTHTDPDFWFQLNGKYDEIKLKVQDKIVHVLKNKLPFFSDATIKLVFSSTPLSWSNWVYRKKGRVGGIPQSMSRSLTDWTPNKTPFDGLFLCGDTVFPGQGIPGVTLSGINVYCRAKKYLKNYTNH